MSLKLHTIYFTLIKFTHVQKEHSKKFFCKPKNIHSFVFGTFVDRIRDMHDSADAKNILLPFTSKPNLWHQKDGTRPVLCWCPESSSLGIGHVRYINILTWFRGFRVKIANFLSFFCLSIPKRDLETKKTTPNLEVCPESLGAMLEY